MIPQQSGRIVFVNFLEELKTPERHFEMCEQVEICTFVWMIKLKFKSDDLVLFSKEYAVQTNCA